MLVAALFYQFRQASVSHPVTEVPLETPTLSNTQLLTITGYRLKVRVL